MIGNYIRMNRKDECEKEKQLELDISTYLKETLDDYGAAIEYILMREIKEDVMLSSAYDEGYWSMADIKLAFGRVLCQKLNIEI